jgi:hypothetical protein
LKFRVRIGGSADSGFTAAVGAPTVSGTCPIGEKAHSPDEVCHIDILIPRAKALALVTIGKSRHPPRPAHDPRGELRRPDGRTSRTRRAAPRKPLGLYLIQSQATCGNNPSAKKISTTGTASLKNRCWRQVTEQVGFRHPLPHASAPD